MRAITAAGSNPKRSDDGDLRPIPLGAPSLTFLRPDAPRAWEPVGAAARALDRLQRRSRNVHQEVRRDADIQRLAER